MTVRSLPTSSLSMALAGGAVLVLASACGSSPTPTTSPSTRTTITSSPSGGANQAPVPVEKNPPGDIPDNLGYVPYTNHAAGFRFTHPEGWAQTMIPQGVAFTDKLNGVSVTRTAASSAPTVASARQSDVAQLRRTQAAFELRSVTAINEPGGHGVLIVYRRNSAPDAVTGRQYRDQVERYQLLIGSHVVVMELVGPVGSDNADPYRKMITSLRSA